MAPCVYFFGLKDHKLYLLTCFSEIDNLLTITATPKKDNDLKMAKKLSIAGTPNLTSFLESH